VQVAVMFALMTNILQFAWWKLKKKKGTYWQRRGPLWILLAALFMVCTQPVAMLVVGSWEDMPNFFFDGGDTGAPCTVNSFCGSGQCVTTDQDTTLLVENLWHMTGCDPNDNTWDPNDGKLSVKDVVMPLVGGADSLMDSATIVSMFFQSCQDPNNPLHTACAPDPKFPCTDLSKGTKGFTTADPKADTYLNTADCQCAKGNFDTQKTDTAARVFSQPWLENETTGVKCGCSCAINSNMLVPNTPIGLFIQIFCTYGGFILMFTGVFMATNLHIKIANMWKALRKKF
jgi:hypothetical protein